MMGNEDLLTKLKLNFFKMSIKNSVIKKFNHEFSFLIRTVFFVFLGVVVELTDVGVEFFIRLFVIILLIIISRYIAVSAIFKMQNFKKDTASVPNRSSVPTDNVEDVKKEKFFMLSMIGRALATAIMAYMPLNAGIPGTSKFPEYAFTVIIATNVLLTAGVWYGSHKFKNKTAETVTANEAGH
jgi:cell volume regulation protein A